MRIKIARGEYFQPIRIYCGVNNQMYKIKRRIEIGEPIISPYVLQILIFIFSHSLAQKLTREQSMLLSQLLLLLLILIHYLWLRSTKAKTKELVSQSKMKLIIPLHL